MEDKYSAEMIVGQNKIGWQHPAYFIADVAANHDGDLERAKDLIYMVAESGGQAAKFQHFKAESIVSDAGFKSLGSKLSHQAKWKKSVFDVYKDASINPEWTSVLKETCDKAGITFFTSPYSLALVDEVDPYVPAYKIGSGDITWHEIIEHMATKGKPIFLASGASTMDEVERAVNLLSGHTKDLVLMQCNTNYSASLENFRYINLNVLNSFSEKFPGLVLGLSDHTPGHATVLGAVAKGARVIEKHFTDDNNREGPDHKFSMNINSWREMVERTRELEAALGDGIKKVEANEKKTVILQRRSLHLRRTLPVGATIRDVDLVPLRPCPEDGIEPADKLGVVGKVLQNQRGEGEYIKWTDLK